MNRASLPEGEGMLFVFEEEGRHAFWMKNMLIALDILWISADGEIVDIKEGALPCGQVCPGLNPGSPAKYVLEVPVGFVRRNDVRCGDRVRF